ncbi:carbohydrate-binding family 9-like protein [Thalassoglobus sp. JC818]|uniref:carbohydrate-binding family 9-like protein n=1 Tax=Thalassoglobus sp. JC818 TaxID=3232136 RepID=UPI0034583B40
MNIRICVCLLLQVLLPAFAVAEENEDPLRPTNVPWPPVSEDQVKRYTALRTIDPIQVDGRLTEETWQKVPRSPRFVDLIRGHETVHNTQAAVTWDDKNLYVAFWVEDPFVTAKIQKRDDPVYTDNDVEVFIAFDNAYYEFEINPFGTIYEGLFIWQSEYERSDFSKVPELDRSRSEVRSQAFNGVGYRNHPRGPRIAFLDWDFPGAVTSVAIDGTLNDDSDRDRGWTVELAFPWAGMKSIALGDQRSIPPENGDIWRMDFSRFNQFQEAGPVRDSQGWAWSYHGCWDSHIPEVFPFVTFSNEPVGK